MSGPTASTHAPSPSAVFWRLYPLYLAVTVMVFASSVVMDGRLGRARPPGDYARDFAGHLFFWHYWDGPPSSHMGITPVFWTIAIEVHFYVLYVLLYPVIRRVGVARFTVAALAFGLAYRFAYDALNV